MLCYCPHPTIFSLHNLRKELSGVCSHRHKETIRREYTIFSGYVIIYIIKQQILIGYNYRIIAVTYNENDAY